MIDNYETKSVIYIDKKNRIQSCGINLINKSENKRILKRYEYYKKVFYEKMEERVNKKAKLNYSDVKEDINNFRLDLNKTT